MLHSYSNKILIKLWNQYCVPNPSSSFYEFIPSHGVLIILNELILSSIAFTLDKLLKAFVIRLILFSFTLIFEN